MCRLFVVAADPEKRRCAATTSCPPLTVLLLLLLLLGVWPPSGAEEQPKMGQLPHRPCRFTSNLLMVTLLKGHLREKPHTKNKKTINKKHVCCCHGYEYARGMRVPLCDKNDSCCEGEGGGLGGGIL